MGRITSFLMKTLRFSEVKDAIWKVNNNILFQYLAGDSPLISKILMFVPRLVIASILTNMVIWLGSLTAGMIGGLFQFTSGIAKILLYTFTSPLQKQFDSSIKDLLIGAGKMFLGTSIFLGLPFGIAMSLGSLGTLATMPVIGTFWPMINSIGAVWSGLDLTVKLLFSTAMLVSLPVMGGVVWEKLRSTKWIDRLNFFKKKSRSSTNPTANHYLPRAIPKSLATDPQTQSSQRSESRPDSRIGVDPGVHSRHPHYRQRRPKG